jgi:hypothetical protein
VSSYKNDSADMPAKILLKIFMGLLNDTVFVKSIYFILNRVAFRLSIFPVSIASNKSAIYESTSSSANFSSIGSDVFVSVGEINIWLFLLDYFLFST